MHVMHRQCIVDSTLQLYGYSMGNYCHAQQQAATDIVITRQYYQRARYLIGADDLLYCQSHRKITETRFHAFANGTTLQQNTLLHCKLYVTIAFSARCRSTLRLTL